MVAIELLFDDRNKKSRVTGFPGHVVGDTSEKHSLNSTVPSLGHNIHLNPELIGAGLCHPENLHRDRL